MAGFKHTIWALLLMMVTGTVIVQNNTNSPYTRHDYDDLSDQSFGNNRAMGGIVLGFGDGAQINLTNPAPYTIIDSLMFLSEGGVSLQNMNISDGGLKLNAKNASFDYLAMQFRLAPWMAMSAGLLPYSNVEYTVSDSQTTDNGLAYNRSFTGNGGLCQMYVGAGVRVLKNLSVGVSALYFRGDITRIREMFHLGVPSHDSYQRRMVTSVSNYRLDPGARYTQALNKRSSLMIGAVYSLKHKLNNDYTLIVIMGVSSSSHGTEYKDALDATLELPNTFGVGFTYNYDKRLTVGADYSLQQWSKTNFGVVTSDENVCQDFNETLTYCDRTKISAGAEYTPSLIGRPYLAHIKYRLGAYCMTSYYKIDGKKASCEYGVTAGSGLPAPRSRSVPSTSGQFARVKGLETNMVNENIFRVNIGLAFNERWFSERRVE